MKPSNRHLMALAIAFLPSLASAQAPKQQDAPFKYSACVQPIEPYGEHVRFSPEDHVKILIRQRSGRKEYRDWEMASMDLDWFSGNVGVPLSTIKSHMPRAMLLSMRFPVDKNPKVDPKGYARLLDAERKYEESVAANDSQKFYDSLMKKYGIGPAAQFDEDMGGATPFPGCGKYEERTK